MNKLIPQPAIIRLCALYQLLCTMEKEGIIKVSSAELEEKTGMPSHTIRKDISFIGEVGSTKSGYEVVKLKQHIQNDLGLNRQRTACIVGLGRIGSAVMQWPLFSEGEFRIVAGFDSDINKVETIKTAVSVFPSYEIPEVVRRTGVEVGIIAVPPGHAQEVADRLMEAGVKGIVNLTPAIITAKRNDCFIRSMDIGGELRILSAMMKMRSP
jgi:redox-sensing transcriptional repressor